MPVVDQGLEIIGSFIAGLNPTFPGSCAFGSGSQAFIGSKTHLEDEKLRSPITWTFITGTDPEGEAILSTTEAVGSYVAEIGLVQEASVLGSDILTRDPTGIGSKLNTFDATIRFVWRTRRA